METKEKRYKIGFFGGKFMPMHKGHLACVAQMSEECEHGFCIMFINGTDEARITHNGRENYLSLEARIEQLERGCKQFPNIIPAVIDVSGCRDENGIEIWEKETPLVRAIVGNKLDAVYGSEPTYADYFARAYPEAEYRILDPDRNNFHISGTMCREMSEEERKAWMV